MTIQPNFVGKNIMISAGGTGGHVYPALAVAKRLRELGAKVEWLGTQAGIEARLVPEAQIVLHTIFVQGVRGNGIKRVLQAPFVIASAVMQAKRLIKQIKPDLFIGFGGFASGPGALAAKLSAVPVIAHEQNAAMGLTNRLVSKWATRMLLAFPIAGHPGTVIGNPVRQAIAAIDLPQQRIRTTEPFRVLVMGGSLGAQAINEAVPQALAPLLGRITLTHQTGKATAAATLEDYRRRGLLERQDVRVVEYIDDMPAAYANADLLIARAGALTVSEVAAVGLAAIFIPLPQAADNHQFLNAKYLANQQAAKIIEQTALTPEHLQKTVTALLDDTMPNSTAPENAILRQMAEYGRSLSHADALDKMIAIIDEVIYANAAR